MKKKLGLITYHRALNYGSVLQAYALQKVLNKSFKCEIIDYQTDKQKEMYTVIKPWNNVRNIVHNVFFLLDKNYIKKHRESFLKFYERNLIFSKKINNRSDLTRLNREFDAFCCGSDQVWNVSIADFDDSYFLSFADKFKFSYAPSLGNVKNFNPIKNNVNINSLLRDFEFISVREKTGKKELEKYTKKPIKIVLDPTLLLNKKEWDTFLTDNYPKEKYIFFYSIDYNKSILKIVKMISKELKLPVYVIFSTGKTYSAQLKGFKRVKSSSPEDFITLIKHAEYVISTSFHGTVFSLIYHKEFILPQVDSNKKLNGDDRLKTLLSHCNIEAETRIISQANIKHVKSLEKINYNNVDEYLQGKIVDSLSYIEKVAEKINGI